MKQKKIQVNKRRTVGKSIQLEGSKLLVAVTIISLTAIAFMYFQ